jgi:hypothetical protein
MSEVCPPRLNTYCQVARWLGFDCFAGPLVHTSGQQISSRLGLQQSFFLSCSDSNVLGFLLTFIDCHAANTARHLQSQHYDDL